MSKVNKTILSVILVFVIVLTTIGVSYSYFSSSFDGDFSTANIEMTNGTMTLGFSNGQTIGLKDIYPSDDAVGTKAFSVTGYNTTFDLLLHYKIKFVVTKNEFNTGDLRYTLSGVKESSGGSLSEVVNVNPMPSDYISISTGAGDYDLGTGYFSVEADGEVHKYQLNIYYPETNKNQSNGLGKLFSGYVTIEGVNEA